MMGSDMLFCLMFWNFVSILNRWAGWFLDQEFMLSVHTVSTRIKKLFLSYLAKINDIEEKEHRSTQVPHSKYLFGVFQL